MRVFSKTQAIQALPLSNQIRFAHCLLRGVLYLLIRGATKRLHWACIMLCTGVMLAARGSKPQHSTRS